MSESPEEIEAEQSHPDEHGDTREVERVTDGEAGLVGYRDEEFFRVGAGLVVVIVVVVVGFVVVIVITLVVVIVRDFNVVADHEEQGREEDEEDVGADDFALKFIHIIITWVVLAVNQL